MVSEDSLTHCSIALRVSVSLLCQVMLSPLSETHNSLVLSHPLPHPLPLLVVPTVFMRIHRICATLMCISLCVSDVKWLLLLVYLR